MQAFIGGGKVRALEVHVNGRYLLTAGLRDGTLLCCIGDNGEVYMIRIGGIDHDTDEYVDWSVPEVGVGGEITIKFVESDQISPVDRRDPVERTAPDEPPIPMATSD